MTLPYLLTDQIGLNKKDCPMVQHNLATHVSDRFTTGSIREVEKLNIVLFFFTMLMMEVAKEWANSLPSYLFWEKCSTDQHL